MSAKVVIIAAIEREIAPLVKGWRVVDEGVVAAYRSFQSGGTVVVCAGIGSRPARLTAESALSCYQPDLVISAGLAGATTPELKIGQEFIPSTIVNSANGARLTAVTGSGVLVSASGVAGPEAKRLLTRQFAAMAVDMEAAAVAEVAEKKGVPFMAVKAISDEYDFAVPDMEPFVDLRGRFLTGKFVRYAAIHPGKWGVVRSLRANSLVASRKLCSVLRNLIETGTWSQADHQDLRPTAKGGSRIP
jgi:adenosylhomocysteine nucleosidase